MVGKYISFNTQKRDKSKNDFEKDFFNLLVNAAFGSFLENVRNRLRLDLIIKDNNKNFIEQQSKLTSNGIHKPYENFDSYTFKQNELAMDKAKYVGFAILDLISYICMKHIMINYNLILDNQNYNCTMLIRMG